MKAQFHLDPFTEMQEVKHWFRKSDWVPIAHKFQINLFLEFSEEERAILTEYDLWEHTLFVQPPRRTEAVEILITQLGEKESDLSFHVPLSMAASMRRPEELGACKYGHTVYNGIHRHFDTYEEAVAFQAELKKKILPRVKELLAHSGKPEGSSETLEF